MKTDSLGAKIKCIIMATTSALCLAAGCRISRSYPAPQLFLFDTVKGTTWVNHVKLVPDPLNNKRQAFLGERESANRCQMTFYNEKGFFNIPHDMSGAVVLNLLVQHEGKVTVALVSDKKLKKYHRYPAATNAWCEIVLPLAEAVGKLEPGDKIKDVTIWLNPSDGQKTLPKESFIYFDKAMFDFNLGQSVEE